MFRREGENMAVKFIHLHNHSDYSLLDGAASVKNLVAKAVELGMSHLEICSVLSTFIVPPKMRELNR